MKQRSFAMVLLFIACMCSTCSFAQANTEEKAVAAVIHHMFDAMRKADSVSIMHVFAANAHMETIAKAKQQTDTVKGNTVAQFASSIARQKAGALDERIRIDAIKIDGQLAVAWTPYEFYLNGRFSHCGVNSFQLVKLNGEWKIQYIIDTRRKDNCL